MVALPVAMLVGNAFGQVGVVLITSGRSSGNLANALLILVTNVGLDLLLIPRYGIAGAAGAAAITISGVVPYAPRTTPGRDDGGAAVIAPGLPADSALQGAGTWRYRRVLRLSITPGLSFLGTGRRAGSAIRARSGAAS
jgi:hypothetical protein